MCFAEKVAGRNDGSVIKGMIARSTDSDDDVCKRSMSYYKQSAISTW